MRHILTNPMKTLWQSSSLRSSYKQGSSYSLQFQLRIWPVVRTDQKGTAPWDPMLHRTILTARSCNYSKYTSKRNVVDSLSLCIWLHCSVKISVGRPSVSSSICRNCFMTRFIRETSGGFSRFVPCHNFTPPLDAAVAQPNRAMSRHPKGQRYDWTRIDRA